MSIKYLLRDNLRIIRKICGALVLLLATAVGSVHAAADFVGPDGGMTPELSMGADGNVYLSWVEERGSGHALRFAVFNDQGWSAARTATVGDEWMVNWADRPSVTALGNGVLIANWRRHSGGNAFAYEIRMALSRDGGQSWEEAVTLNDDRTATEHGFISTVPGDSKLDAVWLDGRRMASGSGEERSMSVRHAAVSDDGTIGKSTELDARTCECCQASLVAIPGGLLVAYRDRTQDNIRDIVVRDNVAGRWSEARSVHEDHWKFNGCPVNGPVLGVQESTVAAAWFTAASNKPQVLVALSNDGGTSFGPPVRVDEGKSLGRVALVMLDNGEAIVSWMERRGGSSLLKLRRVRADATLGQVRTMREIKKASSQFPRMVRRGENVVLVWVEKTGKAGHVHAVVVAADQL